MNLAPVLQTLSEKFVLQNLWIEDTKLAMQNAIHSENRPEPLNPLDQAKLEQIHKLYVEHVSAGLVILQKMAQTGQEFKEGIEQMDTSNQGIENLMKMLQFMQQKEVERFYQFEKWKEITEIITKTQEQIVGIGLQPNTFRLLKFTSAPAA